MPLCLGESLAVLAGGGDMLIWKCLRNPTAPQVGNGLVALPRWLAAVQMSSSEGALWCLTHIPGTLEMKSLAQPTPSTLVLSPLLYQISSL